MNQEATKWNGVIFCLLCVYCSCLSCRVCTVFILKIDQMLCHCHCLTSCLARHAPCSWRSFCPLPGKMDSGWIFWSMGVKAKGPPLHLCNISYLLFHGYLILHTWHISSFGDQRKFRVQMFLCEADGDELLRLLCVYSQAVLFLRQEEILLNPAVSSPKSVWTDEVILTLWRSEL